MEIMMQQAVNEYFTQFVYSFLAYTTCLLLPHFVNVVFLFLPVENNSWNYNIYTYLNVVVINDEPTYTEQLDCILL